MFLKLEILLVIDLIIIFFTEPKLGHVYFLRIEDIFNVFLINCKTNFIFHSYINYIVLKFETQNKMYNYTNKKIIGKTCN